MLKKISLSICFFLLLATANAQINLNMEKPDVEFLRALNAFEKELYNKAIRGFERYINTAPPNEYKHEAQYYIVTAKLRLQQDNAYEYAIHFMEANPVSQRLMFVQKELGDYFYYQKDFKKAARYYAKVDISILDRDETDEFLFRKGYSLFEAGKFDESRDALYPLTLRPHKNFAKAVYYYGYVCYKTGDYTEALNAFLKIEDKGPQSMKLYICQMYYLKGEYAKAIEYADKVDLGKLEVEKNILKGKAYYRLRDFDNAAKYFGKGYLSYDDLSEQEIYEVGYSYYKTEQCNLAFVAFGKIANYGTAISQLASYHMGECFVKKGKKQNAYNAFFEAQRTDFDKEIKENAMFNMAKIAFELEDYKTAIGTFNRFIEMFPDSRNKEEAQKNLAKLFLVTTDYKAAIPILEGIKNLDAESKLILHQILILRGEELFLNKEYSEAKTIMLKAAALKEKPLYTAVAYFWLGEIEFIAKNKPDAIKYYQNFISSPVAKETPYFVYAHYAMGYSNFDQKKYAEALNFFNRFKALNKEKPGEMSHYNDATLRIADCQYSLRNYNEALDNYSYISAKRAAGSDYALFQQGMIFGLQSKPNQKINTMKSLITLHPGSVFIEHSIYEIASEWMQLENFKEAERNFRYLLDDYPNSAYCKNSLLSLGVMFYTQEKDDQALVEFKELVKNYPGTSEAKSGISYVERIYVSRGESEKYLAWLETVPNTGISISFRDSVSYQGAFNLYMNNNCQGAVGNFTRYLEEFPKGYFVVSARFYLATCLDKMEDKQQSSPLYRQIVAGTPNEFREESAKRLATYYFVREQFDSSLFFYERLEAFSSERSTLMNSLLGQVRSAYELSNLQIAESKGSRLLKMDNIPIREQGEVRNKIAILYYELGELDLALNYFNQTLELNRDEKGAEAYYFNAQILFDKLFLSEAKQEVFNYNKRFASVGYWQARCFLLLAEIYYKESDMFQAKATLNFVFENYDDAEILERAKILRAKIEG